MNWYKESQNTVFNNEQKQQILWTYYDGQLLTHSSDGEYTVHQRAFPNLDINYLYRGRLINNEEITIIPPWAKINYSVPDKLISLLYNEFGYDKKITETS
jgi:hypothetical protein